MKYLKLLILTIGFISCDNRHVGEQKPTLLSNLIRISDNEDKGVKDILEFYGGYCEYAFGNSGSVPNGGKNTLS